MFCTFGLRGERRGGRWRGRWPFRPYSGFYSLQLHLLHRPDAVLSPPSRFRDGCSHILLGIAARPLSLDWMGQIADEPVSRVVFVLDLPLQRQRGELSKSGSVS